MTTKQKYLYIVLPFFILNIIINFYVKDDNSHPPVKEYLLNDFEKTEYQVKDLVTGEVLGDKITMQLGMDLYEEFENNVFNLSYTTILEKLDASIGESRQIHKCFDKQQTGIKLHE